MERRRWLLLVVLALVVAGCSNGNEDATASPASTVAPAPTGTTAPSPTPIPAGDLDALPRLDELGPGWTKMEPGGDTRCALDTPYAFWVKPGTVDKLLIYLQGGGGCWSVDTCAPGSTFYDSAVNDRDDPAGRGGILNEDHPQNPFRDYHVVYIPSCTGDVHWGNNVRTYQSGDGTELTIYHRGFVNASTALQWAYQNVPAPESVFIAGCSAGSVGSVAVAPYVIEQYPDAAVNQLGDSLAFVFHRPVEMQNDYGAGANFPDWIPALAEIDPAAMEMADYVATVANYYPEVTFGQYNTQRDRVQTFFYQAVGGDPGDFAAALAASLSRIHAQADNFVSYTASGSVHCILPRGEFYSVMEDDVALQEWVTDLANDRPVSSVQCPECSVEAESR